LFIEGHCRFDVPTAISLAAALADYDIGWFEEPVGHWNKRGLAEVAQRSPMRVATGENFTRLNEFVELTALTRNLVLQPDVMNLGGLEEARQVCELGEALELPVAPHDAQGPISKALCLQLAARSSAIVFQEDFEAFNEPWTHTLASPLDRQDGHVKIPDLPGLGRSLNFKAISQHPYDAQAVLPLFEEGWERRRSQAKLDP
jgi:galactonate dehydratase